MDAYIDFSIPNGYIKVKNQIFLGAESFFLRRNGNFDMTIMTVISVFTALFHIFPLEICHTHFIHVLVIEQMFASIIL